MVGSNYEVLFVAAVLAISIGGSALYSFFSAVDSELTNSDLLPHERDFNGREAELEEEKRAA